MDRCNKLIEIMDKLGVDTLLITDMTNVRYFSGFCGSAGYLVITGNRRLLVTDFRYTEQAAKQAEGFEIADVADFDITKAVDVTLPTGFENETISYSRYSRFADTFANLVPIGDSLVALRSVKDPYEINCIKQAADIADRAFLHMIDYIRPGVTEAEVALELEMYMRKQGAEGMSFEPIVASGANASMPHATPSGKAIEKGELVIMDFGCVVAGYCSDMTRTVAVGDISPKLAEVYNDVAKVQFECLGMVKPGADCRSVHMHSSQVLNDKYPGCYGHGLGHGVGLEVHEMPSLSTRGSGVLVPNNVVTVEPGVYISGFCGVRIEDLVLITDNGMEILSKSTKELIKIQ